jgi:demethylmenaquinone methyltransferase/2-methoxy-6-polyprenyl-1,4-benzoquinol methylase
MTGRSPAPADHDSDRSWFGFREVALGEKQGLVDRVFDRVASRYDLMNDLMSGGLHRLWKDALVNRLAPPRRAPRGWQGLDVAGGTGDIAFRIARRSEGARITVADINGEMLAIGRDRAVGRGLARVVTFVEANAEDLPFASGRFDAVTIAFGIRNVPRIERALAEAHRVLRPGGRFLCLEFSAVDVAVLDRLYDLYSFNVIPMLGQVVTGDGEAYRYLVESIRRFPNQARFAAMIEAAGFARVDVQNLSGGIAAIHSGWKI